MSQGFQTIAGSAKVKDSRALLVERDETLRTNFSGTAFPTSPAPIEGQVCWRTDLGLLFRYDGAGWRRVELQLFATVAALKAIDAATQFADQQRACVLGRANAGDGASFFVRWVAASATASDDAMVFRPTTGPASTGAGRWLREHATPSQAFTSGDSTPSIAAGEWFVTAGSTAITDFDDAFEGQTFVVERGAADIVITHDATKIDLGGANQTLTSTSPRLVFRHVGGVHRLIAAPGAGAYKPSGNGAVATTVSAVLDALNFSAERYGAIGDGTSHPVSQWVTGGARDRGYANLAAITAQYPHVASLSDEIDWAAITQTLTQTGRCVLDQKDYYIGGNKLVVGGSQTLEGIDPNNSINGTEGTRITCALSSSIAVELSGGAGSLPTTLRNVHVRRATGTIPSASKGVRITSSDYVLVENVYSSHHAVGFDANGQLDIVLRRCLAADILESYFDVACPAVTLEECGGGRNGLTTGAGAGAHYLRIFNATDTLYMDRCVFADPGTGDAADCILFASYSNANGIFAFTDCHWEGFSDFIVTSSTTTAQRISLKGCTATCSSATTRFLAGTDTVVSDLQRFRMGGCLFDGTGWVFNFPGVTGEINGNYFSNGVTIDAGKVAFVGNTVNGSITLTGAQGGSVVVGNCQTSIIESSVSGDFTHDGRRAAFRAHKNGTDQTGIVSNTNTKITFATEAFDTGGFYDAANSKWTPPRGQVSINATITYSNATVGGFGTLIIFKNGARFADGGGASPAAAHCAAVNVVDQANGTDYYEVYAVITTGGTVTVSGVSYQSFFCGMVQ